MAWTRVCIGLLLVSAAVAEPPYYHREADWVTTLIAAREGLLAFELAEAGQAQAPTEQLSVWQSAGPFFAPQGKEAYELAFAPERGTDPAATMDNGRGQNIPWVKRPDWQDGKVWDLPSGDHSTDLPRPHRAVVKEREVSFHLAATTASNSSSMAAAGRQARAPGRGAESGPGDRQAGGGTAHRVVQDRQPDRRLRVLLLNRYQAGRHPRPAPRRTLAPRPPRLPRRGPGDRLGDRGRPLERRLARRPVGPAPAPLPRRDPR